MSIRVFVLSVVVALLAGVAFAQSGLTYVGQWSANRYAPSSVVAPGGIYGGAGSWTAR